MYRYRGKELKMLSRLEYFCCVRVMEPRKDDGSGEKKQQKRRQNGVYPFDKKLQIHTTHKQILRSKQVTLKFIRNPPPHPGIEPDKTKDPDQYRRWRKKADKFAAFYLILIRLKRIS